MSKARGLVFGVAILVVSSLLDTQVIHNVHAATSTTTTMKLKDVSIGSVINLGAHSYVKIADNQFMQTEAATCPDGKMIAGKYVKCFDCPAGSQYDAIRNSCTCNDSDYTYNPISNSCVKNCPSGKLWSDTAGACIAPILFGCDNPTDTMQKWRGCDQFATPTGDNYSMEICLMDERDGRTYAVRKFVDGQCWMVTNLAYAGDLAADTSETSTITDACFKTTFTGAGSGNVTNRFGTGTYGECMAAWMSNATLATSGLSAPNYYQLQANPDAYINNASTSTKQECVYTLVGKFGYSYDWPGALQRADAKQGGDMTGTGNIRGLCPEGWHVPGGSSDENNEYTTLKNLVSGPSFWYFNQSWNAAYNGCLWNSTHYSSYATSIQSTQNKNNNIFNWYINPSFNVATFQGLTIGKNGGQTLRCLAD